MNIFIFFKTVVRFTQICPLSSTSVINFILHSLCYFSPFGLSRRTQVPAALLVAEFHVSLTLNLDLC